MEPADILFVERTRELALKGLGTTYPNPLVGAVIVHDGKIIGEGFHYIAGGPHAEIVAIEKVKNKDLLKQCTLYVSLEPCNHHGKTPPCTESILKYKIPRVVIDEVDLNPKVYLSGIQRLIDQGVEVIVNYKNPNVQNSVNKRFFTFHSLGRPYIILKWAESLDGYIDGLESHPLAISGAISKQLSHKWRTEEEAILIGKNTFLKDDPQLNPRDWQGEDMMKFVIDRKLEVPISHRLYKESNAFIFNELKEETTDGVTYLQLDFSKDLIPQILKVWKSLNVQSVIVEGGQKTLQSFIDAKVWDDARVFTNPELIIGKGIQSPHLFNSVLEKSINSGEDILNYYHHV